MNYETVTWAKIKSWTLSRLSHPGAPLLSFSTGVILSSPNRETVQSACLHGASVLGEALGNKQVSE